MENTFNILVPALRKLTFKYFFNFTKGLKVKLERSTAKKGVKCAFALKLETLR